MSPLDNPALPKGSLVLVTGANGNLASHISDQFLQYDYKVRAVVRDIEKNAWLAEYFEKNYGKGVYELVQVPDLTADGALDEAIKGVGAVVHTASETSFSPDPNVVVTGSIALVLGALKAAYATDSVKRFVFTSSSSAAVLSHPDIPATTVTEDSWCEFAVQQAWADPPYKPERAGMVYAASKVQAEQALWKFQKENAEKRPDLVVNSILPNFIYGKLLDPVHQGSKGTCSFFPSLYKGVVSPMFTWIPRQYYVNVQDAARLHFIAATFPEVKQQRIFAFAGRYSFDKVIDILKEQNPGRTFPDHFSGGEDPNEIPPAKKAEKLLQELGRPGYVSLEDTVADNVAHLRDGTA
ncbi:unnamed protein product [Clonostachys byssicola]|uniref:NAD-dependent epimerase/dehydratase domain-containing protein n=1 Tax=Clonostachys byssicola TaxID=160290 RepID=A0A9N9U375_9HYPO|nr:unnamed protein product [Clonostachys byssicola]